MKTLSVIYPKGNKLNEKFTTEYADIVDWCHISSQIDLNKFSDEFFIRFEREINWYRIREYNKTITTEFAHKHQNKIGSKRWYKYGVLHREDGPAVVWPNGTEYWYLNGNIHRINGPAIICTDGNEFWYLNGRRFSEEEFKKRKNTYLTPFNKNKYE